MARQLFALLGYFPKWYRSAISNVNITYSAEDLDKTDHTTITLPLFTQIKDADNDFVYTLFGDADGTPSSITFTMDGKESPTYKAIEGTIQHLTLNGSEIIYLRNLDSDNRVYLPDYNVAQNGIFISTVVNGSPSLNFWRQVDNLYTEDLNSTVYSFGVDILSGECYVEFPQDIATLIGEGLSIYYVLSTGSEGNVPIGFLDSFYDSTVVGERSIADTTGSTSINLSSENVTITNTGLTFTGKDPETIDEAYKNYKKTVGTFDTLVTLRDYNNAIYNTGEVSNCVVTDRTNDIQSTYKIISETSDLINYEYMIDDDMSAFDLKVYALNYNDLLSSKVDYDLTFTMFYDRHASLETGSINSNLYQLVKLLDDQKCICHDFNDIETGKICLLKNKFTINCNIIPVAAVSDIQKNEIKQNISQAIYQALNARNIEFGDKAEYDIVYRIILNSDKRIKAVMLDNIEYNTYAIYCESTGEGQDDYVWKEVCISDQHSNYLSGYLDTNNSTYGMYENYYTTVTAYTGASSVDNSKFIDLLSSPATYSFSKTSSQWYLAVGTSSITVDLDDYGITPTSSATTAITVTVGGVYLSKFTNSMLVHGAYYMDLRDEKVYQYDITDGQFKLYSDKRAEFRTEVFAKSILAGVTPYLVEDGPLYQYQLVQQLAETLDSLTDIDHVSTNVDKTFQFDVESTQSTVTLNENETVQFSRPSLFEEATYSTYVKYVMIRPVNSQPIMANTDYVLNAGEQLIFLYKENEEDDQYKRDIFGPGTIICPSFLMRSDSFVQSSIYSASIPTTSTTHNRSDFLSVTASDNVPDDDTLISLTATNTITIKSINQVSITSNNNFYVITSRVIEDNGVSKYVMRMLETSTDGVFEYTVQQGEYFIYTNAAKTILNILGTGTKITYENDAITEDYVDFANNITATSNINAYGVAALSDIWQTVPSAGFTITEQEFINVLPGGEITFYIAADSVSNLISIPQYTISSTGSGASANLFLYSVTSSSDLGIGDTQTDSKIKALVHDLYYNMYGDSSSSPEDNTTLTNPPISFVFNPDTMIEGEPNIGFWQFYDSSGTLRYIANGSAGETNNVYQWINFIETHTSNSVTFTKQSWDGGIAITGTASGGTAYSDETAVTSVAEPYPLLVPGNYSVSVGGTPNAGGYPKYQLKLRPENSESSDDIIDVTDGAKSVGSNAISFTISEETGNCYAYLWLEVASEQSTGLTVYPAIFNADAPYGGHGLHYYINYSFPLEAQSVIIGGSTQTIYTEILTSPGQIDVGYKAIPAGEVDLSSFDMVKYKQPDGTEGSLNLSLSDTLKWSAKSFLTLDCSLEKPQVIREGQSITFIRGDATAEVEYENTPIYLFSDMPVYTIGGTNIDITTYSADGEIETPSFYAFTLYEQPATTTDTGRFDYISDNNELRIILPKSDSQNSAVVTINSMLPAGDYILPVVNRLSDMTSITITADGAALSSFNGTTTNFKDSPRIYYVQLHVEESDGETPTVIVFTLTAEAPDSSVDRFIIVRPLLRYVKIDSSKSVNGLDTVLRELDTNSIFDYTYRVNSEQQIDNPLDSAQFFNYYHIDNKFTIAQVDGFAIKIVS